MSVGGDRLIGLARSLASVDAAVREDGCGRVTDWISSFSRFEARLVGMLLAALASVEANLSARESELHALCELADTDALDSEIVAPVRLLDRDLLGVSEREYVTYLTDEYPGPEIASGS
jgi:hypothetical protein